MKILGFEPAVIAGLIGSIIALAISFGVKLSTDQVGAIMAVVVPIIGLLVRSQVTPTAKLQPELKKPAGTTPDLVRPQ